MTTAVSFSLETKKWSRSDTNASKFHVLSWTFRFYEEGGSKKTDELLETELL